MSKLDWVPDSLIQVSYILQILCTCALTKFEAGWILSFKKKCGTLLKSVGHLLYKSVGHKRCPTMWDKSVGHVKLQYNT